MASAAPIDFVGIAPMIAERLLGQPNARLSNATEKRYGSKGSLSVDLTSGMYFDHERKQGGGMLDLIKEHRGGDSAAALSWLEDEGLKDRAPVISKAAKSNQPKRQAFYDYRDEEGAVLSRVKRTPDKRFFQLAADGAGGFRTEKGCMDGVRRVPYRLPELVAAGEDRVVFIVEGEKDVDRLTDAGLIATCNSEGAGKFRPELAPHFAGRRVVVLADNDPPGFEHANDVVALLGGIARDVSILLLPDLGPKGDVSDWLDASGTIDRLKVLAARALENPVLRLEPAGTVAPAETFPLADLNAWQQREPTPKGFLMAGFVPSRELTLATGKGGANKSTFGQQLATCCAAGIPMLGVDVSPGTALYVTAEDDEDRLHWMQVHICRAVGTTLGAIEGKLHLCSLRGRLGNELATFDHDGTLRPSAAFAMLKATIKLVRPRLLVLDNAAHLFAGNENDRGQVTAFVNLLYALCAAYDVTIVLVAHANKAGDSYSGSTAWLNAVRSQIVLARPEDGDDPDQRVLTLGKANYARQGEELRFRWHDFALIRDEDLPSDKRAELTATIAATAGNARFLELLDKATSEKRAVSVSPSARNFAPRIFAGMTGAKGMKPAEFEGAMERLLHLGEIIGDGQVYRRENRAWVSGIVRTEAAPTPAPTMHQPPAPTRTNQDHQPAPGTHPYTTYRAGGASTAPAPATEHNGWSRRETPSGMIFAPGEDSDDAEF